MAIRPETIAKIPATHWTIGRVVSANDKINPDTEADDEVVAVSTGLCIRVWKI